VRFVRDALPEADREAVVHGEVAPLRRPTIPSAAPVAPAGAAGGSGAAKDVDTLGATEAAVGAVAREFAGTGRAGDAAVAATPVGAGITS